MAKNYVCNGAKIECQLCTKPEGTLKVTSNEIKVQDKIFATEGDKEKTNLIFEGNCKKSTWQASPCASVIKPEKWEGVADLIVQDHKALLEDSTIMCAYGGVPIKITDHLQKSEPKELQPVAAPVIDPIDGPMLYGLEWKSNKEGKSKEKTIDVADKVIEKTVVGEKVWLEVYTMGMFPGEKLTFEIVEEKDQNTILFSTSGTIDNTGNVKIQLKSEGNKGENYKLIAKAIYNETTTAKANLQIQTTLKKFMVHFRRPSDYNGKYGFDWLRDEYIYPIETVTNDNNGTAIGTPTALCKDVAALKTEYKTTDVVNPISPYGNDYYPAWLSIFPYTTTAQFPHGSRMHKNGVSLDLEIEELKTLVDDATEILFESNNPFLKITPSKLNLKDLIGSKKTKNLGGTTTRDYYLAEKKVNIKCEGGTLNSHEEIKIFAKLGVQKEEVGKLMVYKNNVIPKAEIVAINVITSSSSASLRNDYQYLFKNQSFNQALIRAEIKVDTKFDINSLPSTDTDVINFKANYVNASSNIGTSNSTPFKNDLIALYEKFGKHAPSSGSGIDTNTNTRTYLFYTTIKAQDNFPSGGWSRVQGSCSAKFNPTNIVWGNAYVVYSTALNTKRTVLHEGAHSFSLTHTFQEGTYTSKHIFYKGFLDNIMDYVNQVGVSTRNPYEANDNMNNFFKWQWDILRTDRSLILTY